MRWPRRGRRSTAWRATCSSSAATHPVISPKLLRDLLETHRREDAAATILSFRPPDPREYGRVIRDGDGSVQAIVEAGDASPDELAVDEVNSSIYVFAADRVWPALDQLDTANEQGELYLTDAVRASR